MTDYRGINSLFNQQTTYPACRLSNKIWRPSPGAPNDSANLPSSPRCVRPFTEAPAILSYLPCTIPPPPRLPLHGLCTFAPAIFNRSRLCPSIYSSLSNLTFSLSFVSFVLLVFTVFLAKVWRTKKKVDEAENESSRIGIALKREELQMPRVRSCDNTICFAFKYRKNCPTPHIFASYYTLILANSNFS